MLTISPQEPNYQELKLQVYRDAFGQFIKEFKTYQPLLSAIKKEYENTLAYQKDQIRELEPLRSSLRQVTEECDRKIQARWAEEQSEIGALKREKQQLHKAIEAMREKGKAMQALIEHLQHELSNQYLQYREEHDARKLLIWQLSDLTSASVNEEHPADENTEESKDPVELQLALKVCREDLAKAQEELNRMKAEHWDVVPRCNWETLEQTHKQTLLQMKTLQGDFDQLKSEYDTLLDLQKRSSMQAETHDSSTLQAVQAEFPLKSDEEVDVLVTSAQSDPDKSNDIISTQRLNSLHIRTTITIILRASNGAIERALVTAQTLHFAIVQPASALDRVTTLYRNVEAHDLMVDQPLWEQIGSSFVQHYYQMFDSDRSQLGSIYIDASCLTWEGQQFQGKRAIVEKLSSLPFTKIAHSITAQDHQPTPDCCILSMVVGQLKADDDPVMGFHQSFILKNINDAWVCTNDMFRLAIHNFG
ncbi:hypothetical protein INR49_012453 [Caranx melampygus]|nr:hypothetical protein INR49_012453 [Caranx melampygus]